MGVYVYLFSKTSPINATLPTGDKVPLYRYRYGFKPSLFRDSSQQDQSMMDRAVSAFKQQNRIRDYAFIGDKPKEGLVVYTHLTTGVYADTSDYQGIRVGWLAKKGRSWTVVPEWEYSYSSGKKITCRLLAPGVVSETDDGVTTVYDTRPDCLMEDAVQLLAA